MYFHAHVTGDYHNYKTRNCKLDFFFFMMGPVTASGLLNNVQEL